MSTRLSKKLKPMMDMLRANFDGCLEEDSDGEIAGKAIMAMWFNCFVPRPQFDGKTYVQWIQEKTSMSNREMFFEFNKTWKAFLKSGNPLPTNYVALKLSPKAKKALLEQLSRKK